MAALWKPIRLSLIVFATLGLSAASAADTPMVRVASYAASPRLASLDQSRIAPYAMQGEDSAVATLRYELPGTFTGVANLAGSSFSAIASGPVPDASPDRPAHWPEWTELPPSKWGHVIAGLAMIVFVAVRRMTGV